MQFEKITKQEINTAKCLVLGYSNQEIGQELGISANAVKIHITKLIKKVGARNRTHVAYLISANKDLNKIIFQ